MVELISMLRGKTKKGPDKPRWSEVTRPEVASSRVRVRTWNPGKAGKLYSGQMRAKDSSLGCLPSLFLEHTHIRTCVYMYMHENIF